MEETFEQQMDRVKEQAKPCSVINLNIIKCPMSLYVEFVKDIHLYNKCYWAKLQDLIRKAEMYDFMVSGHKSEQIEQEEQIEPEPIQREEDEVLTIGDLKELRGKVENDRTKRKQ